MRTVVSDRVGLIETRLTGVLGESAFEVAAFRVVGGQRERVAVRVGGFGTPVETTKEIGACRRQQVVSGEHARVVERVHEPQPGLRSVGHPDRDRAIELDDRRRDHPRELLVERGDLHPVGRGRVARGRMTRGDRGLHLIRAGLTAAERGIEEIETVGDRARVPLGPVLFLERDEVARGVEAGAAAGIGQQEQREQAEGLGLVRHQRDERAGEPDRLRAQLDPHELGARGRGVALVEQQVENGEHGARSFRQRVRRRDAIRDARVADLVLGAHEALRHRGLGHEEGACDLGRGQSDERSQRRARSARRATARDDST